VARRTFRLDDDLPGEPAATPHWIWQRGGWIVVDRTNGHISQLNFPGFDSLKSVGEWYRDYFAYCAVEEDGKKTEDQRKIFAVVTELGRRKQLLKQTLSEIADDGTPDSGCVPPVWQRKPARVTFQSKSGQKISFTVRGSFAGEMNVSQNRDKDENDDDDDEDSN
jgi:hypothetical protein